MDATTLKQIAEWSSGIGLGTLAQTVTRVCTDSRLLVAGDLFVALRGEKFDGHQFVQKAAELGAAGAMVDHAYEGAVPEGFGLIKVSDTLKALQDVATHYRKSLPLRVVGITGSSGKTSTKDFTAAVLGEKFRVVKTEGNFNNHIGLPLTILRAGSQDEVGIFEMGMNHAGEIAPLAAMAKAEVGIITNIGVAHIEFLGSREAIALEKGALAESLPSEGTIVLKATDDFSESIAKRTGAKAFFAAIGAGHLRGQILESELEGTRFTAEDSRAGGAVKQEFYLPTPGVHMVENALLAIAAGLSMGVSMEEAAQGLAKSRLTKGRLEQRSVAGIRFLDDSYNANPDSMRAALSTLSGVPTSGARIAVLGRMGELGVEAELGHRSVGRAAAEACIDYLITVGDDAVWISEEAESAGLKNVHHVSEITEAADFLAEKARPGDLVLLKGSRSARMERLFEHPAFTVQLSS